MKMVVAKSDDFRADVAKYFTWYLRQASEVVAWRFQAAMEFALERVAKIPDLGAGCRFRHPRLRELRFFRVERPFNKILIFYHIRGDTLEAWRLMHGSRNLAKRLLESPHLTD